jgi:flagellar secretion chaperone FliS
MFASVSSRSANAYRKVAAETCIPDADPHQLVEMLYDGLLSAIGSARSALSRGDIPAKCKHIDTAVRIIDEGLTSGLNLESGGEIAADLKRLYDFCNMRLTIANARNDEAILAEVIEIITPLALAWKQIRGAKAGAGLTQ